MAMSSGEKVDFLATLGTDWKDKVSILSLPELVDLRERFNVQMLTASDAVEKVAMSFMMSVVSAYIDDEKDGTTNAYAIGKLDGPRFLRDSGNTGK
jgi:hypothetical protein